MNEQVAVIGGGISGLACAYRLFQLGVPVTLLEAEEHSGGLIGTVEQDGFLFETGPQSFQGIDSLLDLVRDIGLENHLCHANARAPRYVLRHGKLEKIPLSPQSMLGTSLLGVGSRWRIASEVLKRTKPPTEEESVAQFVRRKFGHEILEYLVAPFVSGVYAGDPEKLSLRAAFPTLDEWERSYGSILRGAMKSRPAKGAGQGAPPLCSFRSRHVHAPAYDSRKARRQRADRRASRRHHQSGWGRRRALPHPLHAEGPRGNTGGRRCGDRDTGVHRGAPGRHDRRSARAHAFRNSVCGRGRGRHGLPRQSNRRTRRLRCPHPAQRENSHARHCLEFVAVSRSRRRRPRDADQLRRRRDGHWRSSRRRTRKFSRSCRTTMRAS